MVMASFLNLILGRDETRAQASRMIADTAGLTPPARWDYILKFKESQKDPKKIKATLCELTGASSWKAALLGVRPQCEIDIHFVFLQYHNGLHHPIEAANRARFFSSGKMCGAQGSTFATNKAEYIKDKDHLTLDAAYGYEDHLHGFSLALGDGIGGHAGIAKQDRMVGRASHFATKTCARLFAAYKDPDQLKQDLVAVVKLIGKEVQQKALLEGSTLVGCRAFPVSNGSRIIGCNIGDTMLVAIYPDGTLMNLLPSHCTQAGPAFLPDNYRSFELQMIDIVVPEGTILFLMSDGAHDALPYREEEKTYPNGLVYRSRTLTPLPSSENSLNSLVENIMKKMDALRQEANTKLGDDFSILRCQL